MQHQQQQQQKSRPCTAAAMPVTAPAVVVVALLLVVASSTLPAASAEEAVMHQFEQFKQRLQELMGKGPHPAKAAATPQLPEYCQPEPYAGWGQATSMVRCGNRQHRCPPFLSPLCHLTSPPARC